jgi:hypothetical protein
MSELLNRQNARAEFRRRLLVTVSSVALLASIYGVGSARAEDADRPLVWIELGGQGEQMGGNQGPFAPPFAVNMPNTFFSLIGAQNLRRYSFGEEGSISFEPAESDWVLSASVRYGRFLGIRQRHQETPNAHVTGHLTIYGKYQKLRTKYPSSHVKFADAKIQQRESHTVLDFQVGKDVGLGMFGDRATSVFSAGVRFAQFSSKTSVSLHAEPDVHYPSQPITNLTGLKSFISAAMHFHSYAGAETAQRSFHGLGPSIAWKGSTPFMGNSDRGELTFDWGANAAVLFGRQRANGHHQTTVHSYYKKGWDQGSVKNTFAGGFATISTAHHSHAADFIRMKTVVVPNFGGVAGISYRFTNAKLSVGYRADFFMGAMDGGIDAVKKENRGFYGPFASIGVGLP